MTDSIRRTIAQAKRKKEAEVRKKRMKIERLQTDITVLEDEIAEHDKKLEEL